MLSPCDTVSARGECSACHDGYRLEYEHPASRTGPLVCREICDDSTSFRASEDDVYCRVKQRSLFPGAACKTSQSGACSSGLCSSGSPFESYGNCCNEDAANAKCSAGCERSINHGACSATSKSKPGGSCATSDDCYNSMACVGGVCCAFSSVVVSMYDRTGLGNCTACSTTNGECSSCKPGARLTDVDLTKIYDAAFISRNFHSATSSTTKTCFDACDSSTEFNAFNANPACWKKAPPGTGCYAQWAGPFRAQ